MMKLKKFASVLALTIAVSQVFAVVPAHAEETTTEVQKHFTCVHERCDEEVTDYATCNNCIGSGEGAYTWVKVDDKTHNEVLVCEWCGSEKEVLSTGLSHSNWKNGKCRCGYNMNATSGGSVSGNDIPIVPQKSNEEVISEALAQATEETIRAEEAMPVTSFVSIEAINTLPAEVKETSATETVYNLSKITTTRGFVAAVDKIVKAKTTTEAVTFYSSKPIAFNVDSLTALTNAATEFVYMFNHEGHLYKITIPADAKVDLAGQTFAGPLYIGAQLGTSVLVK